MQIFLVLNGQSAGPFDEAQVRAMMAAGQATPETQCCPVGEQSWRPLGVALGIAPLGMPLAPYAAAGQFAAAPPTNGLALTSLILGCAAPLLCCSTGIPAVICGHIALGQIKKSNGAQGGRGLAVAGLVIGYVLTGLLALYLLVTIGLGVALPVFSGVQTKARETKCLAQAKQVGLACKVYAADNDGKFPPRLKDLIPTYLTDDRLLLCPLKEDNKGEGYDYTGGTDTDPANKVLLRSRAMSADGRRIVVHVDTSGELVRE